MRHYYMGDDEILGGEYDEIMGGDVYGGDEMTLFGDDPPRKQALGRRLAATRAAGGVVVEQMDPTQMRRQVLPFRQAFTAGLSGVTINLNPQRKFRPERLSFASLSAQYFLVTDVSIAQEPQFVQAGGLLAQLFTEVSVGMELRGKTANLGAIISITASNLDADNARTLYGQVTGTVVM